MYRRHGAIVCALLLLLFAAGCSSKPSDKLADSSSGDQSQSKPPSLLSKLESKPVVLPEGTVLTVRISQTLSSKGSRSGDAFSGVLAEPVEAEGKVIIPKDSPATGTVTSAAPLGRFKGGAKLAVVLDSVTINGTKYDVQTTSVSRSMKGKGKRSAAMIGGGAGGGALIGALAGGGKGAAIGALVGGGAGTAGAAFTGNKDIVFPAESALSFRLEKPLSVKM